jgi:hypothetical protein
MHVQSSSHGANFSFRRLTGSKELIACATI